MNEANATDEERFEGFTAYLVDSEGTVLESLGGVTFPNNDIRHPYANILFAELAEEAIHRGEVK